jgi:polar amino acid transport system permease protein
MDSLDFSVLVSYRDALLRGLLYTIELTLLCGLASLIFGFIVGVGRQSSVAPIRWISSLYVEIIRGTPVLITLFWVFFCFPLLFGVEFGPFLSSFIALTLFTSAITSESFRSALKSIGRDQYDACKALGLSQITQSIFVVAPQAVIRAIPNLMSNMVSLFKRKRARIGCRCRRVDVYRSKYIKYYG